jgi:hypothetical protein
LPAAKASTAKSKADLYKAYAGKTSPQMFHDFQTDRQLQLHAIVVTEVAGPLEYQYVTDLQEQAKGSDGRAAWAAKRASGTEVWWATAIAILLKAQSMPLMARLGLSPPCNPPVAYDNSQAWLEDEKSLVKLLHHFATILAANTVWANMMFMLCLPSAIAGLLHTRKALRREAMDRLKTCLEDVAFNVQQLPREIMARALQCGFDADNQDIRLLALNLYAGSATTKDILESTFAHLTDILQRQAKCQKMADHARLFYAIASPYASSGGVQQILPTLGDWLFTKSEQGKELKARLASMANPMSTPLSEGRDEVELPKSVKDLVKSKWKAAGPLSHQRSAAAIMYLIHDSANDFSNVGMAWTGLILCFKSICVSVFVARRVFADAELLHFCCLGKYSFVFLYKQHHCSGALFGIGNYYFHVATNRFILCFGFRKWAAVGYKMASKIVDETVPLLIN